MDYDFPEFPRQEYENRLSKLKAAMSQADLDAVVLTEEVNIRWLAGYWVFTMMDGTMPTAVIVPLSDRIEPQLIVPGDGTGEELSWMKKVRYWERADETLLTADKGRVLLESLREASPDSRRIGMELGNGMMINLDQKVTDFFRASVGDAQIVDVSKDILEIRSVKSSGEIEKLRKASEITNNSMIEGFKILREGMTERGLGQFFVKYWFENGATGIGHVGVTFARDAIKYAHSDPKEYPLEKGALAKVDIGCTFEGYRSDMYRMACIGNPDSKEAEVASTIEKALRAVTENIREGARCSELHAMAAGIFESKGLEHLLSPSTYIGHGIGLAAHEPPYLYNDSKDVLQSGMVLSIEPWTLDRGNSSLCMNIEDVVVVRKDGCEVLTTMPREIFQQDTSKY